MSCVPGVASGMRTRLSNRTARARRNSGRVTRAGAASSAASDATPASGQPRKTKAHSGSVVQRRALRRSQFNPSSRPGQVNGQDLIDQDIVGPSGIKPAVEFVKPEPDGRRVRSQEELEYEGWACFLQHPPERPPDGPGREGVRFGELRRAEDPEIGGGLAVPKLGKRFLTDVLGGPGHRRVAEVEGQAAAVEAEPLALAEEDAVEQVSAGKLPPETVGFLGALGLISDQRLSRRMGVLLGVIGRQIAQVTPAEAAQVTLRGSAEDRRLAFDSVIPRLDRGLRPLGRASLHLDGVTQPAEGGQVGPQDRSLVDALDVPPEKRPAKVDWPGQNQVDRPNRGGRADLVQGVERQPQKFGVQPPDRHRQGVDARRRSVIRGDRVESGQHLGRQSFPCPTSGLGQPFGVTEVSLSYRARRG